MTRAALVVARVVLLGAFAFAGACASSCGDQPLVLRKVLVDVEPGIERTAVGVDREAVRTAVHGVLLQKDGVKIDEANDEGAVLRVRLESAASSVPSEAPAATEGATAATPAGLSLLSLSVEVQGGGGAQGTRFQYRGHSLASATGAMPTDGLVRQAFDDALSQVLQARGADRQDSEVLLAWLKDGSTAVSDDQKRQAIRILGARRDARAVEPLTKVLLGSDRELAQLSLSALTSLGDPSAIDAVIAYSERKPSLVRKQCIEAVRVMGSPKAAAWLFTLSTGHQDQDVQAAANAALLTFEVGDAGNARVAQERPPSPPTPPAAPN